MLKTCKKVKKRKKKMDPDTKLYIYIVVFFAIVLFGLLFGIGVLEVQGKNKDKQIQELQQQLQQYETVEEVTDE